ncbi:GspH/FimT family pseudopilin [Thiospirillum jenense]|uniref:Type II secretion system protein H n=1 Tax=Thiospirillum jenense TaxID=1653858 RepID=A0A839HGG1_9GAMM|nr:GspH/FimT family pseudopilin [Thiospirillum jenense]MBB1126177.1 GspH/FimT family pseudopilin [Thiospirillum jenense]
MRHLPLTYPVFNQPRGFTLVELLVVMAIAGLLIAVTPPLMSAALPGIELKAAARRTAGALRIARELAIHNGRTVVWQLNTATGQYRIVGDARAAQLPGGIELTLTAAEEEMINPHEGGIRFFADGSATGGRVVLTRNQRGYQVGVNWLTGQVIIADWSGDNR